MSEKSTNSTENVENNENSYVPASPKKRTLAWIALVYVVGLLVLTTYFYFTGTMLGNLGPLFCFPGLVGAGVLIVVSHRTEGNPPSKRVAYGTAVLFWLAALCTLPIGIVGLMSNFGG